jgi:3-deoxy-D-manno-octulosonic-acid transferase
MILTYRILTTLIYPLLFILIYLRKIFKKEDSERYKEKILVSNFNIVRNKEAKLIWFHAASIGEVKSIIPVIDELNVKKAKYEFLITTTTLSSSNLIKSDLQNFTNIHHRFFPFDINFLINKFLELWKPNVIFLVDSEIWPNLIINANKKKIPLVLINARITFKTFKRWMLFPKTAKKIFNLFDLCLSSNSETKNFLTKLNAKNIYFRGNIKLSSKIKLKNINNLNKKILSERNFWFAASTHKNEDVLCLKVHSMLKERYKDIITVIAPRHIKRVKNIKTICESLNLNVQVLNKEDVISNNKEIIIINSFGVLQDYFKYAKSVFIGKSTIKKLENVGGQNPIEAAKLGCKIYHGPYVYNFKEIYEILEKNNISKKIENYTELSNYLIKDLINPEKEENKISHLIDNLGQKTLTDTMKLINNFLSNEVK